MHNEDRELLEEIYDLLLENNKMLKAQRRAKIFERILKLIWLAVIVAVPLWLYYTYLEPVLGNLQNNLKVLELLGGGGGASQAQLEPMLQNLKKLMDTLNQMQLNK